jgi:hypothetical protein
MQNHTPKTRFFKNGGFSKNINLQYACETCENAYFCFGKNDSLKNLNLRNTIPAVQN